MFGRLVNDVKTDRSPHGFRSSFQSWYSDEGIDRELAEQGLVHAAGGQVEQCYARSDCREQREVMEFWGAFLAEEFTCRKKTGFFGDRGIGRCRAICATPT